MGPWIALGLLIVAGLVLVLQNDAGTIAGLDNASFAGLVAGLALLIYLGGSVVRDYRGRAAEAARHAITWAGFALILVGAYSLRGDLTSFAYRIAGELVPGMAVSVETEPGDNQAVRIRRQGDGHFVARTHVNGIAVPMMVDTGAATIVLSSQDAQKIGINTAGLSYRVPVRTANGLTHSARIRLNQVEIGALGLTNVDALIAQPGDLHHSLLGMSFLSRLRSYEFSGDFLTLRG
jgi:aspartyl protease family protein